MVSSSLLPFALLIGVVVGGYCFFRSITSLATALHLLVVVVIFGGIIGANLGGGGYAVLFRDLCIVIPIYLSVVTTQAGRQPLAGIPVDILLSIVFFVLVIVVCLFNPIPAPVGQIIVGIKVWLFYIPFLAVGIVIAYRTDLVLGLVRQILFWGAVACAVGLLQSLLVRLIGYEAAIHLFFGDYAVRATQGFTRFEEAGGIYRIPGTFSFVAQYGNFLCLYLTIAAIALNADPDERVRRFAAIAIFIAVLAGMLSGTRALILIFPAMLGMYALCGVLTSRVLLLAPIAVVIGVGALSLATLNPLEYFYTGEKLATQNANDFILQQIDGALENGLLGGGIGSSTTGARYAIGGSALDDVPQTFYEVYFAKAGAELGWLGFAAIIAVFLVIASRVGSIVRANLGHRENAIIAPAGIYIAYTVVMSIKGSVLDIDPSNIFFWLMLGLLIGRNNWRRVAASDHEGTLPQDQEEGGVYEPA